MRTYDLSQPLNQEVSFWPYYPPFEVKYIKRKAEHGVNAQYIQTSNHMGTHLDAPRHFVTNGRTIDEIPIEWLCGPGVIVDLVEEMETRRSTHPQMIEKTVKVKTATSLILHTGFHRYSQFGAAADEERYIHMHPGAHPSMVPWLLRKGIHIWGVDCVSTDHLMNLPIGRFLGKACTITGPGCGRPPRPSSAARRRWTKCSPIPPTSHPQRPVPQGLHAHREHGWGDRRAGAPEQALHHRVLPLKFRGGEAAFCRAVAWLGEWPKNP